MKPIFAVLLLAFWLAATQHCGLEAAQILPEEGANHSTCCEDKKAACGDNCDLVENGSYRVTDAGVQAPAPVVIWLEADLILALAIDNFSTEIPPDADSLTRPLDWVPAWSFVRREAPAPRAPSLLA